MQPQARGHGSSPSGSFLVRHWRGDFSLPIAYWVFGVALTLVVTVGLRAVDLAIGRWNTDARVVGFALLSEWTFLVVFCVWQLVGIWRSADRHVSRGGRRTWANLAKLMLILGVLRALGNLVVEGLPIMSEGVRLASGIDDTPAYAIRLLRDGTELELSGGMPFGTSRALEEALGRYPDVRLIHMNSDGGRINEAYRIHGLIRAHGLITYTSTHCVSACALAFMAGRERYIAVGAQLGFHSTSVGGVAGASAQDRNNAFRRTLRSYNVPEAFIDRALSVPPDDMWYPSHDELLEAKVVDAVVDARHFGMSAFTEWRQAEEIDRQLLENPLFRLLSERDPDAFRKIRAIFASGVAEGRAAFDIGNEMRSVLVGEVLPKLLRSAADPEVIAYWRVNLDEMNYLAGVSPEHCADFTFPDLAETPLDTVAAFPPEMMKRDTEALVALARTAGTVSLSEDDDVAAHSAFEALLLRIGERDSTLLQVLEDPEAFRGEFEILCNAAISLYSEVLSDTDHRRMAAILRYMGSSLAQ